MNVLDDVAGLMVVYGRYIDCCVDRGVSPLCFVEWQKKSHGLNKFMDGD